ncbi:AMP-activated serine/threonine-protein kinase regulatory subunit [Fusarium falciforme]
MEGNPETEPARGHDSREGAGGDKLNQAQTRDQVQVHVDAVEDDPAKAHVQSWIKDQIETQPQQPPPEPQIIEPAADEAEADGDGEGDDEVPRAGANPNDGAAATDTTGTGAGAAPTEPPVAVTPTAPGRTRTGPSTETSTSTTAVGHGLVPQFVAPSSYLRPRTSNRSAMAPTEPKPPSPLDRDQLQGLNAIRDFLKVRTSYDVLPLSFRLIVLDTDLLIKKSIGILTQNSIVSAPLWDSKISRFAGILTSTDFINLIQYYCQFPDEISKLDQFRLSSLRDIEKAIGAIPIETVSVHPSKPLFEACRRMLKTRARRIPLIDVDSETGKEMVVSVITQYRILKFIAVNNEHNTVLLKKTVRDIGLGTYGGGIVTARMSSSVLQVVHLMVDRNISCIPIVDAENRVLNVFEAVDVIPCVKSGNYDDLDGSVGEALCKRSDDSPGIYTCSEEDRLDSIFDTIRKSRVHRLIVVDDDNKLKGIISLSDILKYVLLHGVEDTTNWL